MRRGLILLSLLVVPACSMNQDAATANGPIRIVTDPPLKHDEESKALSRVSQYLEKRGIEPKRGTSYRVDNTTAGPLVSMVATGGEEYRFLVDGEGRIRQVGDVLPASPEDTASMGQATRR